MTLKRLFSTQVILITLIVLCISSIAFPFGKVPMKNLTTYELTEKAATIELAVRLAKLKALKSDVSRMVASGKLIKAIQLLDPYLRKNVEEFIDSTTIVAKERESDIWEVSTRIIINTKKLYEDLSEKGFIYKPRIYPKVLVLMDESINSEPSSFNFAAQAIEQYIMNKGIDTLPSDGFTKSVKDSEFSEIRQYAEQMGAEIVIVGSAEAYNTNKIDKDKKTNFLSPKYFYEADVSFKVLRIDNGDVFEEKSGFASRSNSTKAQAYKNAINEAVAKATDGLYEDYYAKWEKEVLNKTKYQVILNQTNSDQVKVFSNNLKELDKDIEVYKRFTWADIAILNVDYNGDAAVLKEFIYQIKDPAAKIEEPAKGVFDLFQTF